MYTVFAEYLSMCEVFLDISAYNSYTMGVYFMKL